MHEKIYDFINKHFSILFSSILVISISVLIYAIVAYYHDETLYEHADMEMKKAQKMLNTAIIPKETSINQSVSDSTNTKTDTNDVLLDVNTQYMYKRIDFTKLTDVNTEEVYGWLYVPGTNIDYVVMKGNESEPYKYLWKDPLGNKSKTGSLFVRYTEPGEIPDAHTIIYGHRLQDHSLYFGALLDYHDSTYAQNHQMAYLYTPTEVISYSLYSVNDGKETDSVYYYPFELGTSEYEWMINDNKSTETFKVSSEDTFSCFRNMLVLSTCSGKQSGQPERMYLIFAEESRLAY